MFIRQSSAILAEQIAQRSRASPEFWLFNSPATPKEIRRLEARLGRQLPEPLSHALGKINGGFASPEGKVSIDSPMEINAAREKANRFLNCDEICEAYHMLLGSHPDENAAAFPFIPFMRSADGGFLAIHADDPLAAVWDAWTLEGPHLWRRLYPSYGALLSAYLTEGGAILAEPFDDEPTATAQPY